MSDTDIAYLPEQAGHDTTIEEINADAFGPGRFARAAYQIREGGPHDRTLSFVGIADGAIVGSVRQTWVCAGGSKALLLGPLAVMPVWKNRGIGRKLVRIALDAAWKVSAPMVILVGDAPYYSPLGFDQFPPGKIRLPRPVDPARLLVAEIIGGSVEAMSGNLIHADRAAIAMS